MRYFITMGRYLDGEGYDVKLIPPRKSLPKRGIICAITKYVTDIIVNDTISLELSCLSCHPVKS